MVAATFTVCTEETPDFAGLVVVVHGEALRVRLSLADVAAPALSDEKGPVLGGRDSVRSFDHSGMVRDRYASSAS